MVAARRSCGFLLGEAVEGAEAPDEVDGVDADDFAGGEAGGDDVERVAVVCVVEGGDEDERVGDVEVGVAGGEALAFEEDGRGHGEFDDVEGLALPCRLRAERRRSRFSARGMWFSSAVLGSTQVRMVFVGRRSG